MSLRLYMHPLASFCQKVLVAWYEYDTPFDAHIVDLGDAGERMATRTWAVGDGFSMADCAAAPALFNADRVAPLGGTYPHAARYLARLMERPSYARALREAEPYFAMFPG